MHNLVCSEPTTPNTTTPRTAHCALTHTVTHRVFMSLRHIHTQTQLSDSHYNCYTTQPQDTHTPQIKSVKETMRVSGRLCVASYTHKTILSVTTEVIIE